MKEPIAVDFIFYLSFFYLCSTSNLRSAEAPASVVAKSKSSGLHKSGDLFLTEHRQEPALNKLTHCC
jgi:hypothetical protein